jgi:hypothetical protein
MNVAESIVLFGFLLFAGDGTKSDAPNPSNRPDKDPFQTTFHSPAEAMSAMKKREPQAPKVGDPAPDFELASPDGKETVRLSSFEGRAPVVLVFGSYT